jgi:hypothetical protein
LKKGQKSQSLEIKKFRSEKRRSVWRCVNKWSTILVKRQCAYECAARHRGDNNTTLTKETKTNERCNTEKWKKQKYEIINIRDKDRVWLGKPRVTAVGHNPPCICKDGRNAHGKHRCQLWYTEHYLEQYFKKTNTSNKK